MPVPVVAAAAVVVLLAVAAWLLRGRRASPLYEVDRFSTARDVTNRWAEDPSSAPAAVKPLMRGEAADED